MTDSKPVAFRAIDPYIQRHTVLPTETEVRGKDFVSWGDGNAYPDYLLELYDNAPTLRSCVDGIADYIAGDDVSITPWRNDYAPGAVNLQGDTIRDQVHDCAADMELYGGFALQVIRDWSGAVAEVYYIDVRNLRSNKENTVFYYSEDWRKGGIRKAVVYPAFMPNLDWDNMTDEQRERHASSIVYVKRGHTRTYPQPPFAAAVKACEVERSIADFHLNAIDNSFTASMIINFNNGIPTDEQMEEIEQAVNDKFSGHDNAGRIFLCWNRNKESAADIVTPKVEDFGARYDALEKAIRQQIFTAFRANPNLFGIPTDGNGFAAEQYEASFKLFNRTQVLPAQRLIADTYDRIFGRHGVLSIKPFTFDGAAAEGEQNVN